MYMVAFLALRILYVVALVCFVFVPWFPPPLNPFLAMMSSAGYFHAPFLLPAFFSFFSKALHGRLKSQRDGTGGKLTVDPPFSFRRERGTGKI